MKAALVFWSMALLVLSGSAIAQINESDTSKVQLRASFTGNYQTGNVEVLAIKSRLDMAFAPVKHLVYKTQNNSLYQSFYNKAADNDLFSRNYLYVNPQSRLYPYAIGYVSTNLRRKIDLRFFGGAGATYQLVQTKNHVVKLSGNAVYERTKFNALTFNHPVYNGSNTITLWRASAYVGGWDYLLGNKLRLYYDAYWQPALNSSSNYRTQLDIGLDFPLWRGLSFTALYTYTHEHVVAQAIRQTDNMLSFGCAYFFKQNHQQPKQ